MDTKAIQEQYTGICSLLEKRQLKAAHTALADFMHSSTDWSLHQHLGQIRTSYHYMLQYMQQGICDPERHQVYTQLLATTWEIADQARIRLLEDSSNHLYFQLRRQKSMGTSSDDVPLDTLKSLLEAYPDDLAISKLMPDEKQLAGLAQRHEQTLHTLFYQIWLNNRWSADETVQAKQMLESDTISANDLCLMVSAVMLSLMACFDKEKVSWLLNAATHAEPHISQRALVAFAIVMHCYPTRLPLYPSLARQLSILNEEAGIAHQLTRIYIQLLRSQETEKINKIMRDEIIPQMIKSVHKLQHHKRTGMEDSGTDENDINPEWSAVTAGIEDKLREMAELQMEGADVYMDTFSHFKSFPFFQELQNWFYPFDPYHSVLIRQYGAKSVQQEPLLNMLIKSDFCCDSDKYSLSLMLKQYSQMNKDMLLGDLSEHAQELMADNDNVAKQNRNTAHICNQYIQDIYRFLKLNSHHAEFRDIFCEHIALHRIPALQPLLHHPDNMLVVADFLFDKKRYVEALLIFQDITRTDASNAVIWQKTGYCLQKELRYQEALEAYSQADVLQPDHLWTIRHMATCHRLNGDYATALEYYKKAEEIQPENRTVLFYIGTCLVQTGCSDEALQYFFKLDFLENGSIKAWRGIGWCSFILGKEEQAVKYYQKALETNPCTADYLNMGHIALAGHRVETAIAYYKQVVERESKPAFLEMMDNDSSILLSKGIDAEDLPLITDMV